MSDDLDRPSDWPPLEVIQAMAERPGNYAFAHCLDEACRQRGCKGTCVRTWHTTTADACVPAFAATAWQTAADEGAARYEHVDTKDTNPKDGIGATKLPLGLVPATAIALASLAHLDGALKYGKWNWRAAGVRASIYVDALMRHVEKWNNGEECDADSGLPHMAHALACLNILVDAQAHDKLIDDRPPRVAISAWFDQLTPHVKALTEKHAGRDPYHYCIDDSEEAA